MEYVLVQWPDVQALMEYAWFDAECHLLNPLEDQEHYDSAYLVPKHRIQEIEDLQELLNVVRKSKE